MILKWAVFAVFAVATLSMLYVLTHMSDLATLMQAKHRRRRRVAWSVMLQVTGLWLLSVGLVIVVAGGLWASAVGPFMIGLAMLLGGPVYARWMGRVDD